MSNQSQFELDIERIKTVVSHGDCCESAKDLACEALDRIEAARSTPAPNADGLLPCLFHREGGAERAVCVGGTWWIECPNCGASGPTWDSEEAARNAWNRRRPTAPAPGLHPATRARIVARVREQALVWKSDPVPPLNFYEAAMRISDIIEDMSDLAPAPVEQPERVAELVEDRDFWKGKCEQHDDALKIVHQIFDNAGVPSAAHQPCSHNNCPSHTTHRLYGLVERLDAAEAAWGRMAASLDKLEVAVANLPPDSVMTVDDLAAADAYRRSQK